MTQEIRLPSALILLSLNTSDTCGTLLKMDGEDKIMLSHVIAFEPLTTYQRSVLGLAFSLSVRMLDYLISTHFMSANKKTKNIGAAAKYYYN